MNKMNKLKRIALVAVIVAALAGVGASYLYSDAPLPINVPKLGE